MLAMLRLRNACLVAAICSWAAILGSNAQATIFNPAPATLPGGSVWHFTVDSGITLLNSWFSNASPPDIGQGGSGPNATALDVSTLLGVTVTEVGRNEPLTGSAGTYSGVLANLYAIHFGNNELVLLFSGITSFAISGLTGTGEGLSNIVALSLTAVPVPPALLLFGTALAGMGFLGRRRNRKSASLAS